MKTLFLSPPSFDGFDGGAGSRYQARREVTSFWYPTWLAQPAALVPNAKLMDCPPHNIDIAQCLETAKDFHHVIIHTSTPSLKNDCKVAEAIKQNRPDANIGFVGAHAAVLPSETLKASRAIDWVGRKEFDFTCKEVAEGRPLETIAGLSFRNKDGRIIHNAEREMIQDMDSLPWVADVYKRDLQIEKYFIGYLLHPYVSMYTGRGCPAQCTFCLWPQTIGGHKYRVRSAQNVADEMAYMKKLFPQVKEFFFDDDTFTANLPRAREIAQELDVFSIQVSLAAPYPGTELFEMARQNGWFVKKDKTDLVEGDGFQQSALEYPGLSKEEIFESVERFYHRYYLRPKPILRIIKTMLEDKDVCVRRLREGYEFFKSMAQRRSDLEAAKAAMA